jgi:uncharacterized protein (UPF0332 family)
MSLKEQERNTLVILYISKSDEALHDARLTSEQGRWNASANRLYYALFHAITALFVSDGIPLHSHNGMKIMFGKEYVLTGLATDEEGKLLSKMETMRERADYDATFTASEIIIKERINQVEKMIHHIKELIARER